MLGLIQRVTSASVSIEENIHGHINQGILLLLGVEKNDATDQADQLLKKILNYRISSSVDCNGLAKPCARSINGVKKCSKSSL